jgi:predicted enzyme related to lactoylglutathione lyase
MGDPVTTFEIAGKDLKALGVFYQGAFGWKLGTPQPAYTMVYPTEGGPVAGVLTAQRPGTSGHAMFYVEVADLDAALAKIEGLGGRTVLPTVAVPDGPTIAMFADPEGHVVGLWKRRQPQTR